MGWMIMPFQRYFDFKGRSRRMEYWMFSLLYLIVSFVLLLPIGIEFFQLLIAVGSSSGVDADPLDAFSNGISTGSWAGLIAWIVFALAAFIPLLAVSVRRFHDVGMSGWVFVGLYVGSLIISFVGLAILVIAILPGKSEPNKWGPDPKNPYEEDVFA